MDIATLPLNTKLKAEDGNYLTDEVNLTALNTGAVRQLRAETKTHFQSEDDRIARLESLVSQLTGQPLGEMAYTATTTAYKGIESFVVMDARITPKSSIQIEGLSGYTIVSQGEGSFGIRFSTPPSQDTKFTYSSKY